MIPVKVCGITNTEDAINAINNGAQAIGFIFYSKSPRYISYDEAKNISNNLPSRIKKVGVFVNEAEKKIRLAIQEVNLDIIQLHGNESSKFCELFPIPVIKAIRLKSILDMEIINRYKVSAMLFDTHVKGSFGGTGKSFNWNILSNYKNDTPIIISGGLNESNILKAIESTKPSAIDISSGVEEKPGFKSAFKITSFFKKIIKTHNTGYSFE